MQFGQQKRRGSTLFRVVAGSRFIVLLFVLLIMTGMAVMLAPAAYGADLQAASAFNPHEQVGHHGVHDHHADTGLSVKEAGLYTIRAVYYLALLTTSGMLLWVALLPSAVNEPSLRSMAGKWTKPVMRALLIVALLYVFVNMNDLLQGYDGGGQSEWLRLLVETSTGRSWLAVLVIALLGFPVLRLPDPIKASWALLLLAAESFNGHVLALPSTTLAILLDFIHLACASLWVGGIVLLLLYWKVERKEAGRFAERFAQTAWITIVLLLVTGVLLTVQLIPSWLYLIYTNWGIVLLIKTGVVLLICITGLLLHLRTRQGRLPSGKLLKLDAVLLALVMLFAGALTYISPMPTTEPLSYHKMGDRLHYTLIITPNGPGPNEIKLKVWLPEQLGAPSSVKLLLKPESGSRHNVVEVPLRSDYADESIVFPGFKETDYSAKDIELYTRGAWNAEIVIEDNAGESYSQMVPFRND